MISAAERFVLPGLKFICGLLGLEKGGDKVSYAPLIP